MSCDHCEALRLMQARQLGPVLRESMSYPYSYPGDRDDPGACPCQCHAPWRIINKIHL